jgi:hypothetical protein
MSFLAFQIGTLDGRTNSQIHHPVRRTVRILAKKQLVPLEDKVPATPFLDCLLLWLFDELRLMH